MEACTGVIELAVGAATQAAEVSTAAHGAVNEADVALFYDVKVVSRATAHIGDDDIIAVLGGFDVAVYVAVVFEGDICRDVDGVVGNTVRDTIRNGNHCGGSNVKAQVFSDNLGILVVFLVGDLHLDGGLGVAIVTLRNVGQLGAAVFNVYFGVSAKVNRLVGVNGAVAYISGIDSAVFGRYGVRTQAVAADGFKRETTIFYCPVATVSSVAVDVREAYTGICDLEVRAVAATCGGGAFNVICKNNGVVDNELTANADVKGRAVIAVFLRVHIFSAGNRHVDIVQRQSGAIHIESYVAGVGLACAGSHSEENGRAAV